MNRYHPRMTTISIPPATPLPAGVEVKIDRLSVSRDRTGARDVTLSMTLTGPECSYVDPFNVRVPGISELTVTVSDDGFDGESVDTVDVLAHFAIPASPQVTKYQIAHWVASHVLRSR